MRCCDADVMLRWCYVCVGWEALCNNGEKEACLTFPLSTYMFFPLGNPTWGSTAWHHLIWQYNDECHVWGLMEHRDENQWPTDNSLLLVENEFGDAFAKQHGKRKNLLISTTDYFRENSFYLVMYFVLLRNIESMWFIFPFWVKMPTFHPHITFHKPWILLCKYGSD